MYYGGMMCAVCIALESFSLRAIQWTACFILPKPLKYKEPTGRVLFDNTLYYLYGVM